MTQLQFELICKIIENGAPALANELIGSLDTLVKERNALAAELERREADCEKPCDCEECTCEECTKKCESDSESEK